MANKIEHFPRGEARRTRLNLRKHRVACQVSERWLQFPQTAQQLQGGDFMMIDVMTIGANDTDRKLCELVLTKQDLLNMLAQVKTVS